MQREDEISSYFEYELTVIPAFIFKDNMMCKTSKSQLAKALSNDVNKIFKQSMSLMVVP